ncbi:MAG TPA: acetyl-CoA C-acyltransferase [Catalimonadaceae bacterium]|nr:acetyl-CoA C-acyltransferase [Catalimonadaceae bacterium]HPI09673.1 acetyl-CoA C-acyltransferase [Catalimonadaceae bacterium]
MNAYLIDGYRTAVGKAPRGLFRFMRPDDLAAVVIKHLVSKFPQLDPSTIDDLIVGNAVPEAEQGMQMGRMISLLSLPIQVPGMIVNRYCGSGLEAIAIAAARIHAGQADIIIAGGTESMSLVPTTGWKTALNYKIAKEHSDYYLGMGLTAEMVQKRYDISRQDQDLFAFHSHQKAIKAINEGRFKEQIVPVEVEEVFVGPDSKKKSRSYIVDTDEGPRADTNLDVLAKLKPAFAEKGTVTAGNSSQTSDGASFVLMMSERKMKELGITPKGRMLSYAVAGVEPSVMGIGPVEAIPKALRIAGLEKNQVDMIELNEAFASQALAVMRTLDLDPEKVNVNGGAIALGHPLGCSGAKLTVQLFNEMARQNKKYGMVTACVGGGQGVAGIFERL